MGANKDVLMVPIETRCHQELLAFKAAYRRECARQAHGSDGTMLYFTKLFSSETDLAVFLGKLRVYLKQMGATLHPDTPYDAEQMHFILTIDLP